MQAHGTAAIMQKTFVQFNVPDGPTAGGTRFFGTYFDVMKSGFSEFFNKVRRDINPDILKDVVLAKQESKNPNYYTELELVSSALTVFSLFEITKSIDALKEAKFLRTGTSNLFIPTFRGIILSFAVLKAIPQLGQVDWVKGMLEKVSQTRNAARTALADAWLELKPAIQALDKHKFVCSQQCPKCKSKLEVVFDKEREPYLFCEKTSTSGCGAVHSVLVNETGNILVFEPYTVLGQCPKCELSNMRCHNGPYGLFVRCDSCGKTQPFE
jgi:ssDNA-binding Zn-finger/Zn-ribbon topoisomerase 1